MPKASSNLLLPYYQHYLLDTSFLISAFDKKQKNHPKILEIQKILNQPDAISYICGIILAEYIAGQNNNLDSLEFLASNKNIYLNAGHLYRKLATKGQRVAINDCLVAAHTLFYNITLITCDKHFRRFKNLKLNLVNL
jgi:predicted nucleic acid-binding protein